MALAAGVALDDVDVGEPERIDLLDQRQIDRLGIAIADVGELGQRRQADADAVAAPDAVTASTTSTTRRVRFSIEPP